jgi:hypothetical protein
LKATIGSRMWHSGGYIRRSNETLGLGNAEYHSLSEDDGEEISNVVGVGSCEAEESGEGLDFGVECDE